MGKLGVKILNRLKFERYILYIYDYVIQKCNFKKCQNQKNENNKTNKYNAKKYIIKKKNNEKRI